MKKGGFFLKSPGKNISKIGTHIFSYRYVFMGIISPPPPVVEMLLRRIIIQGFFLWQKLILAPKKILEP